jgi:hypothetical protein
MRRRRRASRALRPGRILRRHRRVARRGERALFYRAPVWTVAAMAGAVASLTTAALLTGYLLAGLLIAGLVLLAWLSLAFRVMRLSPASPPGSGPTDPGGAGVREPRRPLPVAPAGAAAMPLPDEDPPQRTVALA